MLHPDDDELFATVYDESITRLSTHRATFGGFQSRLNRALDFIDVYQENIAAAKSKISDTDYATEVTNLLQARIRSHAATALIAQSNAQGSKTMQLLNSIL